MIQNLVQTFDSEQIEDGEFEEYLNKCGEQEYRLHTCELLTHGSVLTVMERYIEISEEPNPEEPTQPVGMEMTG